MCIRDSIGGSYEIRHLGNSVQKSYEEIEHLMTEIVAQQNKRRRSELAALQSQINPHFLYNTLESVSYTHLDVYKRQRYVRKTVPDVFRKYGS